LMTDYSTQMPGGRRGRHAERLDPTHFEQFLAETASTDMDIMLEIQDKEKSALAAVGIARRDGRFLLPADRYSSKE
ncbi:MAG: UV DNA damage repair endonuclease UvsE, partial [Methanoculleus horonobensis]|nr:UV DNA damage repair endonuclease UvsE [Methanoculleus horonobensis]